jgi:hypothetical protein
VYVQRLHRVSEASEWEVCAAFHRHQDSIFLPPGRSWAMGLTPELSNLPTRMGMQHCPLASSSAWLGHIPHIIMAWVLFAHLFFSSQNPAGT